MADDGSITHWFEELRNGDQTAATRLWERYFPRLVSLARARLQGSARRFADEEDVALSVFDSFCRGADGFSFEDRDDLWQLLVTITVRKAQDAVVYERRQKRGEGRVLDESAESAPGLDGVVGREPPPELAVLVAEELKYLLAKLGDSILQSLATMKMEGYSEAEMAQRLGCAERTVRRKLQLIRLTWAREVER
jgi:DNA-directed RNA polymerase specialized sigma24 family protein